MTTSEHDQRQLNKMLERLDLFTKNQVALDVLISDISFLLSALEMKDGEVAQCIKKQWEVLEEVHAVALSENRALNNTDATLIDAATHQIRELVSIFLKNGT